MNFDTFPIWEMDPDLISLGPLTIRYYGILFAAGLLLGYSLWRWQMLRAKHNVEITEKFLFWGVVAVLLGSRFGHCFFYEPAKYLRNPIEIFFIWKGGLASHGATIGLILCLVLYAKKYKFSSLELMDRFAMPTTMGALFVRLGNFMNSEIVGREWTGPWALRFPRYTSINQSSLEQMRASLRGVPYKALGQELGFVAQPLPRHPSQLYEALGALIIFLLILLVDWRMKEKRPRGLLAGMFLLGYFSFRFVVEFFKEFQVENFLKMVPDPVNRVIHVQHTAGLTMGQWLSIPFACLGLGLIIFAFKKKLPAGVPSPLDKEDNG